MGRMLLDTINGYTSYLNFVELASSHNGLASVPQIYKFAEIGIPRVRPEFMRSARPLNENHESEQLFSVAVDNSIETV
jgi:hypothetical protein